MFLRIATCLLLIASLLSTVALAQDEEVLSQGQDVASQLFHATVSLEIEVNPPPPHYIPDNFLGISMEYTRVHDYLGYYNHAHAPVFNMGYEQLLRNLRAGVLRIGGDSQDTGCWDGLNFGTQCAHHIDLNQLQIINGTLFFTNWRGILGMNLALHNGINQLASANRLKNGVTMIREGIDKVFPNHDSAQRLMGLEIGNEPNLYYRHKYRHQDVDGDSKKEYDPEDHAMEFRDFVQALNCNGVGCKDTNWVWRDHRIIGPAYESKNPQPPKPESPWNAYLSNFINTMDNPNDSALRGGQLGLITRHWYSLNRCDQRKENLTADQMRREREFLLRQQRMLDADKIIRDAVDKSGGLGVRVAETNSVANRGQLGVSDRMAAALWGLDYMFTVHQTGAVGVNFHTAQGPYVHPCDCDDKHQPLPCDQPDKKRMPYAFYNPINARPSVPADGKRAYKGFVNDAKPIYYAMLMFAKYAEGGRILKTNLTSDANVKAWWVMDPHGVMRAFIINKTNQNGEVTIIPPGPGYESPRLVQLSVCENLSDPSPVDGSQVCRKISDPFGSTDDLGSGKVVLGGRTVGTDGSFPVFNEEAAPANTGGSYTISLPRAQAIVVIFNPRATPK